MKIYRDESLSNFEFWSGAIANAEEFTLEDLIVLAKSSKQ